MLKPKIKDGVKFYNITSKNKIEANRLFEKKLTEIYNLELAAKKKVEGLNATLSTREVSKLRNHPDLGVWVIDGKPASVTDLNAFLISGKKKTLSLHIPKERTGFTRKYLESPKNMNREVKKWFDRLDKQGWPKGTSRKGFTNFLTRSYDQTAEYNKILEKQLGFKFDAGHFWGAMGPEGNRTIIGPYGFRSEGKFTFRNVTSQPRSPSMEQLLNPKWNSITPNVPGFFDKAGAQIASAEDLLNVGAGGQGWHGALADYLTQGLNDIDKMSAWDKAYIAFGDPSKGSGATPEVRLAELLEPGGKDKVLQRVGQFAETAEDLSGPVTTVTKGSDKWWQLQNNAAKPNNHLLSNISQEMMAKLEAIKKLPIKQRRAALRALTISGGLTLYGGFGTAMSAAETYGRKQLAEETGNPLDKVQYNISRASLAGDLTSYVPTPQTAVGGSAFSLIADMSNELINIARYEPTELDLKKAYSNLNFTSAIKEGEAISEKGLTDNTLTNKTNRGVVKVENEEGKEEYLPMLQIPQA